MQVLPVLPELEGRCPWGWLGAAHRVSRWLTRPAPALMRRTPSDLGLSWQPLECRTDDGHRLAGWVAGPARPQGTVLLFHGLRRNREQLLERMAMLARAGFRAAAFDHRAHGESSGWRTSLGYRESEDVAAVLRLAEQCWPEGPKAAWGVGLGAAALCFAARQARRLDAVVLESIYPGFAALEPERPDLPAWLREFSRLVLRVTERRLGLRIGGPTPDRRVGELAPASVLVENQDEMRVLEFLKCSLAV